MTQLKLYRKRYIPWETVHLKDDKILHHSEDLIITQWITLKPRKDIASGISAYYLKEGIKVSKIFNAKHNLVYWYMDIIHPIIDAKKNTVIIEDLLVDVILYEDGSFHILDLDELSYAFIQKLITQNQVIDGLRKLNHLISIIENNQFSIFQNPIEITEARLSSVGLSSD